MFFVATLKSMPDTCPLRELFAARNSWVPWCRSRSLAFAQWSSCSEGATFEVWHPSTTPPHGICFRYLWIPGKDFGEDYPDVSCERAVQRLETALLLSGLRLDHHRILALSAPSNAVRDAYFVDPVV